MRKDHIYSILKEKIKNTIDIEKPDIIIAPIGINHPDHILVSSCILDLKYKKHHSRR